MHAGGKRASLAAHISPADGSESRPLCAPAVPPRELASPIRAFREGGRHGHGAGR